MAEKLGSAYVEIKADSKKFRASVKDAQNRTLKATTGMQKNFNSLNMKKAMNSVNKFKKSIVGLRGAMVLLATGAVARSIIKLGMDFDRSMNIVKVVSGATTKEFEGLTAAAKKMGEETEFTASQAADALKFLAMAGLTAVQSMKALPQMLDLATAGQIDLARAADISTNVMTMMGLKVEELTKVNDAFVAVQASANTNIEELAQAFIYAGPKAKAFGLSVNDLSALIGLLANAGIKATMAGTTLRQSMIRLIDPPKEAAEILAKYNIVVTDSEGKLNNYIDVLGQLSDAQLTATEITKLFGARAGNIQVILDQGRPIWQAYIDQINDVAGVSKTAAAIIRDDMKGAFDRLKSVIQSVGLSIWEEYGERVKQVTLAAADYIMKHRQQITDMVVAVGSGVRTLVTSIIKMVDILPGGGLEWGLIGWLLFKGQGQAALIVAALVTINEGMKIFSLDVGSLIGNIRRLNELTHEWWEMAKGIRDLSSGAPIFTGAMPSLQLFELEEQLKIHNENLKGMLLAEIEFATASTQIAKDKVEKQIKFEQELQKAKEKLARDSTDMMRAEMEFALDLTTKDKLAKEELGKIEQKMHEQDLERLQESMGQLDEIIAKQEEKKEVTVLTAEEERQAFIKMAMAGDDFIQGMKAGLMELQTNFRTWGEVGYDIVEAFCQLLLQRDVRCLLRCSEGGP